MKLSGVVLSLLALTVAGAPVLPDTPRSAVTNRLQARQPSNGRDEGTRHSPAVHGGVRGSFGPAGARGRGGRDSGRSGGENAAVQVVVSSATSMAVIVATAQPVVDPNGNLLADPNNNPNFVVPVDTQPVSFISRRNPTSAATATQRSPRTTSTVVGGPTATARFASSSSTTAPTARTATRNPTARTATRNPAATANTASRNPVAAPSNAPGNPAAGRPNTGGRVPRASRTGTIDAARPTRAFGSGLEMPPGFRPATGPPRVAPPVRDENGRLPLAPPPGNPYPSVMDPMPGAYPGPGTMYGDLENLFMENVAENEPEEELEEAPPVRAIGRAKGLRPTRPGGLVAAPRTPQLNGMVRPVSPGQAIPASRRKNNEPPPEPEDVFAFAPYRRLQPVRRQSAGSSGGGQQPEAQGNAQPSQAEGESMQGSSPSLTFSPIQEEVVQFDLIYEPVAEEVLSLQKVYQPVDEVVFDHQDVYQPVLSNVQDHTEVYSPVLEYVENDSDVYEPTWTYVDQDVLQFTPTTQYVTEYHDDYSPTFKTNATDPCCAPPPTNINTNNNHISLNLDFSEHFGAEQHANHHNGHDAGANPPGTPPGTPAAAAPYVPLLPDNPAPAGKPHYPTSLFLLQQDYPNQPSSDPANGIRVQSVSAAHRINSILAWPASPSPHRCQLIFNAPINGEGRVNVHTLAPPLPGAPTWNTKPARAVFIGTFAVTGAGGSWVAGSGEINCGDAVEVEWADPAIDGGVLWASDGIGAVPLPPGSVTTTSTTVNTHDIVDVPGRGRYVAHDELVPTIQTHLEPVGARRTETHRVEVPVQPGGKTLVHGPVPAEVVGGRETVVRGTTVGATGEAVPLRKAAAGGRVVREPTRRVGEPVRVGEGARVGETRKTANVPVRRVGEPVRTGAYREQPPRAAAPGKTPVRVAGAPAVPVRAGAVPVKAPVRAAAPPAKAAPVKAPIRAAAPPAKAAPVKTPVRAAAPPAKAAPVKTAPRTGGSTKKASAGAAAVKRDLRAVEKEKEQTTQCQGGGHVTGGAGSGGRRGAGGGGRRGGAGVAGWGRGGRRVVGRRFKA